MNHQKCYESLIHRAQNRAKPEGYTERHHIIPRCLGGNDFPNNLVRLTASEHFIAHLLLTKIHPDIEGLIVAAYLMANKAGKRLNNKMYSRLRGVCVSMSTVNGKINGAQTVIKGTGIHALTKGQRSAFSRQIVIGGIGIHAQTKEQRVALGKQTESSGQGIHALTKEQRSAFSRQVIKNKQGIYAQTPEQLSILGKKTAENKIGIHALTQEQRSANGMIGGKIAGRDSVLNNTGVHALSKEQHSTFGGVGGNATGKISTAQRWQCLECNKITNPGGLGSHQKSTGHVGRVKLS